jgi:hypothetical protein
MAAPPTRALRAKSRPRPACVCRQERELSQPLAAGDVLAGDRQLRPASVLFGESSCKVLGWVCVPSSRDRVPVYASRVGADDDRLYGSAHRLANHPDRAFARLRCSQPSAATGLAPTGAEHLPFAVECTSCRPVSSGCRSDLSAVPPSASTSRLCMQSAATALAMLPRMVLIPIAWMVDRSHRAAISCRYQAPAASRGGKASLLPQRTWSARSSAPRSRSARTGLSICPRIITAADGGDDQLVFARTSFAATGCRTERGAEVARRHPNRGAAANSCISPGLTTNASRAGPGFRPQCPRGRRRHRAAARMLQSAACWLILAPKHPVAASASWRVPRGREDEIQAPLGVRSPTRPLRVPPTAAPSSGREDEIQAPHGVRSPTRPNTSAAHSGTLARARGRNPGPARRPLTDTPTTSAAHSGTLAQARNPGPARRPLTATPHYERRRQRHKLTPQ